MKIEVTSEDTNIRDELRACLGVNTLTLTLGGVLLLVESKSPYIYGGKVESTDIATAQRLLDCDSLEPFAFHEALLKSLDVAFGVYAIAEDDDTQSTGRKSKIEFGSPEWATDIIAMATQSLPSLTLDEILWTVPFALLIHLQLATGRRNGLITSRDGGIKEALAELKKMRNTKCQTQN